MAATPTTNPPPIFSPLPRELRDRIYDVVLDDKIPVPENPSRSTVFSGSGIRFLKTILVSLSTNLSRTFGQIRTELFEDIAQRSLPSSKHGLVYLLDVQASGPDRAANAFMRVTLDWLAIPTLPLLHARRVQVGVRVQDSFMQCYGSYTTAPGLLSCCLLEVLGNFFTHGPTFTAQAGMLKMTFIQELVVDVAREVGLHMGPQTTESFDTHLGASLELVAGTGLLDGKLGRFLLCYEGEARYRYDVAMRAGLEEDTLQFQNGGWFV
ncbi:MAG: hypothetical protein Q9210_000703 [Variospora velana]